MSIQADTSLLQRFAELERRVVELEDERAIRELLTRFGEVMDVGSIADFVALFTHDGAIDLAMGKSYGEFAVTRRWQGSAELHDFLADPEGLWDKSWWGSVMHVQGNNVEIRIDGENALATGYAISLISRDGGLKVIGASANRWQLRKTDGRWLVHERKFRPIGHEHFAAMLLGEGAVLASERV